MQDTLEPAIWVRFVPRQLRFHRDRISAADCAVCGKRLGELPLRVFSVSPCPTLELQHPQKMRSSVHIYVPPSLCQCYTVHQDQEKHPSQSTATFWDFKVFFLNFGSLVRELQKLL